MDEQNQDQKTSDKGQPKSAPLRVAAKRGNRFS
jgi:hypothetical protein